MTLVEKFDTINNIEDKKEIQKLIDESNYINAPVFTLFNTDIDLLSAQIIAISIILWIIIWFVFKLFSISKYGILIFLLYIFYCVYQLFTSDIMTASTTSSEQFLYEKEVFIQNGLNICIFLFVFLYAIDIDKKTKNNIYLILIISIILMIIPCVIISTKNKGDNFRAIRKIKGAFYNKGLFLFSYAFLILFLKFNQHSH
jgi:hypothetical protein